MEISSSSRRRPQSHDAVLPGGSILVLGWARILRWEIGGAPAAAAIDYAGECGRGAAWGGGSAPWWWLVVMMVMML